MTLQTLFNRPLALQPAYAHALLAQHAEAGPAADSTLLALNVDAHTSGYTVMGGIALIPIHGVLMHKLGVLQPFFGMTGYDGIRQNVLIALADPEVRAIALEIDSPGGVVSGCFDLADTIFEARADKPIWAIVNEQACSAAYALASAADVITVPRTGSTGSIGIIYLHMDLSKAQQDAGLKVTLLTYGARKADGHPALPLSDEACTRFEAEIDAMGELFVETVARNRGITSQVVRKTEAGTFLGASGVHAGLADAVLAPDAAFRALVKQFN